MLVRAAQSRELADHEAWDHGWSQASYRRSPMAAMSHGKGAVRLQPASVEFFEKACSALLQLEEVRQSYEVDEFWGMVASLVGGLPIGAAPDRLAMAVERWIKAVLEPPDSLVLLPLANVAQLENLLELGPLVIGPFDQRFADHLRRKVGHDVPARKSRELWWTSTDARAGTADCAPMVVAYTCRSQLERAVDDAQEAFEDLISISLMLHSDLDALSLYSLRGDANRPGIRGLVVDRKALQKAAEKDPLISRELGRPALIDGVFGQTVSFSWYSENPFPLEQLLSAPDARPVAMRILIGPAAVERRLRVAARWHAKAHWSLDLADATLALGICFDSMLSEQSPSPGRVLAERYALLDPDAKRRRTRYHQFQTEYYPARSSVAHGSRKGALNTAFFRRMARDARWVFRRIVERSGALGVGTEDEYKDMYDNLKWGRGEVDAD